jgi:lysophospholipase L1-like esterase
VGVLTACATGGTGPRRSGDALPTGLVGPVAPTVGPEALRYVALGDSYTMGDGVRQADRWPNQLVRILRPELDLDLVANLASRTTASRQVIEQQLPDLGPRDPQFVTLQVGANDVRHALPEGYAANVGLILDTVLTYVPSNRVVVLTIPDFTLTEAGSGAEDAEAVSARIAELNGLLREAAEERGVTVVDVAPIADRVTFDPTLVGADGIHPSAKQYAGWADLVAMAVRALFLDDPASMAPGSAEPSPTAPQPPSPDPAPPSDPIPSPVLITS